MENRRQRREAEKNMGFHKIEKELTSEERAVLKERKREYARQAQLMRAQEAENNRMNVEAEKWSKLIESYIESGKTREEAEGILQRNRELQEKREAKLEQRLNRQKNG